MIFYDSAPVHQEPDEIILFWTIKELVYLDNSINRHLAGYINRKGTFRVTTKIKYFDQLTMTIHTESGRIYNLLGNPGFTQTLELYWAIWKKKENFISEKDVTNEYFQLH